MKPFSILVTQCLQEDFVRLVARHDPLPNKLHVGHDEASRLFGPDPELGPLAQLMRWARAQAPEDLGVVHVRDWHDPKDPAQAEHLRRFEAHCIAGTSGASLVPEIANGLTPRERVVDAITLSDFEGTALPDTLRALAAGRPLRVAVVGVWTEAKVTFLLYDLKTRLGVDALATCSALCASSSRQHHFAALDQLQRILGVEVFHSVDELVRWLAPDAPLQVAGPAELGPAVECEPPLDETDAAIVKLLCRDFRAVKLARLAGGFSGALVFGVRGLDRMGQATAPSVLKLGPARMIGIERANFERVQPVLGNRAPQLLGCVEAGGRAGLRVAWATMGRERVRTFKALWEAGEPVAPVLDEVLGEILGPFYEAAMPGPLAPFVHYGFRQFAHTVRPAVAALGEDPDADTFVFPGGVTLPNVVRFYERALPSLPDLPGETHLVGVAHGDLNTANILVDGRNNVWVIDYFHTVPGQHVLKDVAKLENDLLFILTKLPDEAALAEAIRLTDALRGGDDLAALPSPELPDGVGEPFRRTWDTLRELRGHAARIARTDKSPWPYRIALLRYAVHSLSFDECSPLQKRWALATACMYAADVEANLRRNRRLRVDWVPMDFPGRLGMTLCPGRRDLGRDLGEDLRVLREEGITHVIPLLGADELADLGVADLGARVTAAGMYCWPLPVRDQGAPSPRETSALVEDVLAVMQAGGRVLLHCRGGLGRTGTIAACVLVRLGVEPDEAIRVVRTARQSSRCVENAAQEGFVRGFR
ncbi:MAG: isochorismatase family protein [Myxococcota bacterium]